MDFSKCGRILKICGTLHCQLETTYKQHTIYDPRCPEMHNDVVWGDILQPPYKHKTPAAVS